MLANLSRLFDPRGTKVPVLILAMALNIGWAIVFFSLVDSMMLRFGDQVTGVDTTLMLGIFLGAVTIAFTAARIARDRHGVTYGVYGGMAGLVVIVLMTWRSGLLAALVGLVAVLGGYNGGMLGEMYNKLKAERGNKK